MKKYIGTKTVKAEQMSLGDFIHRSGRFPYGDETAKHDFAEEGYLVEYEDGYQSWSPKDVFEKAYKLAETPLDRVVIEQEDLCTRFDKLMAFIKGDKFETLSPAAQAMLLAQVGTMAEYQHILNMRYTEMESGYGGFNDFTFGVAVELLRHGFAVRRDGWNGRGLFVVKQVPAHIEGEVIFKMQSLPQQAKDLIMKEKQFIDYRNQCLIYNTITGVADSWVPSISDVFAEDWELVVF